MKEYRKHLLLGTLLILLPLPVQRLLGREWSTGSLLPLTLLAVYWFCAAFTFLDKGNRGQNRKPILLVLWILPVMSLVLCGIDYCLFRGIEFSISTVFCLLFGLMFTAFGNYLPKCRQNHTMGIKVSWAYTSEENWNATHRFGGKVWVIGGIVLILAAFLPQKWAVTVLFVAIVGMAVLPILYSWRYYRMQKARGDALTPLPRMNPKQAWLTAVFCVLTIVFVAATLYTGDIAYQFTDSYLFVEADYYDDFILHYDVIDDIEYRDKNVDGIRTWGYGSFRLLMGTFQNEEFGTYTRYTYYRPDSAVVIHHGGKTLVLSGKTPAETEAIYTTLMEKIK